MLTSTHRQKIIADIWARKTRTLLVATSIFVGVLGVVLLFSMGEILVRTLERTIDPDKLNMVSMYASVSSDEPLDNQAYIDGLKALPEVTEVMGMSRAALYWRTESESEMRESRLFSYSADLEALPLEPITLVEGSYPQTGQQQLAIERRVAEAYDLSVGDAIVVRVLGDPNTPATEVKEETWTITGLVFQPHLYPYAPGAPQSIEGRNQLYATHEDSAYLTNQPGFSVFVVRYSDFPTAQANSDQLERYLAGETPYRPVTTLLDNPEANAFLTQTKNYQSVLSLLAVVALMISGFLVFNVVNAAIVEQRRQIGILKSIGGDTRDIFAIYGLTSFVYGVIGVIPGVLLGVPLGFWAVQQLAPTFNILIDEFQTSPTAIIMGICLGLFVPILASVVPIWQGTKVTILEAMTDLGIGSNNNPTSSEGGRSLGYWLGLPFSLVGWALVLAFVVLPVQVLNLLPLPMNLRQALRSIDRKRGRLLLTIITLSLAAGAFMGVYSLLSSLQTLTDDIFATFGNQISFVPIGQADLATIDSVLQAEVPPVAETHPNVLLSAEIEGYKPVGIGSSPAALLAFGFNTHDDNIINFNLRSGTAWQDDPERHGVVITNGIADALGKDTGDNLNIRFGMNEAAYEVIGVTNYPFPTVWIQWDDLAQASGLVMPDGTPIPNVYSVILEEQTPDYSGDETAKVISNINDAMLAEGISAQYTNWVQSAEYVADLIAASSALLNIAVILIGLVGAIGLLSTLSMSVFERQKEIGVMRSLGATSSTVAAQFLVEGLMVGLIAWLIGLPLSYYLNIALINAFNFGDSAGIGYPASAPLVGLVAMLILTAVSSLSPALAAARKTVSDILRYQ
jgi:putative ABC transport system permease protein